MQNFVCIQSNAEWKNGGAQHAKPSWYLQLRTPGTVPRGCLFGAHDTGETAGVAQEESETSVVVTATVGSGHDYRTTIRDSGIEQVSEEGVGEVGTVNCYLKSCAGAR